MKPHSPLFKGSVLLQGLQSSGTSSSQGLTLIWECAWPGDGSMAFTAAKTSAYHVLPPGCFPGCRRRGSALEPTKPTSTSSFRRCKTPGGKWTTPVVSRYAPHMYTQEAPWSQAKLRKAYIWRSFSIAGVLSTALNLCIVLGFFTWQGVWQGKDGVSIEGH